MSKGKKRTGPNFPKEENILTAIIIILVIALIMLVGSAVYEEITNINKEKLKDTVSSTELENEDQEQEEGKEKEEEVPEEPKNEEEEEPVKEEQPKEEYVGEEEQEVNTKEDTTKTKDQRAIELAKNEWGEDNTVTFSVEEKKGSKYYVAVKSDAIVITWYEIDTETWEISEYY